MVGIIRACRRGGFPSEWLKDDHLRREKIMSVDVSAAALLAGFGAWLAGERGLSRETVRCYSIQAGAFLASLPDRVESAVRQLDSGQVTSFMVGY